MTRTPVFFVLAYVLLASPAASAASCEWAERFATDVASYGERAVASNNDLEARRFARDARLPAYDGAKEAKGCGCPAAIPSFEEAALQAMYADRAQNITASHQYGRRIKMLGEKALDTLRSCPAR
jgi:hypothetical protein